MQCRPKHVPASEVLEPPRRVTQPQSTCSPSAPHEPLSTSTAAGGCRGTCMHACTCQNVMRRPRFLQLPGHLHRCMPWRHFHQPHEL